jgi:hypothetical protein
MESQDLKIGDIVQLNPETSSNPAFAGCLMVVTEPKSWGAQGYVQGAGTGALAYYRARFEDMELVGHAEWLFDDGTENQKEN